MKQREIIRRARQDKRRAELSEADWKKYPAACEAYVTYGGSLAGCIIAQGQQTKQRRAAREDRKMLRDEVKREKARVELDKARELAKRLRVQKLQRQVQKLVNRRARGRGE